MYLKLGLESVSKMQEQKKHCFFKSYGFYHYKESLMLLETYVESFGLLIL
jgi:hypothetical protein